MSVLGALIGLGLGSGLALVILGVPWWRIPDLESRLAPYVRDVAPVSGLLAGIAPSRPWRVIVRLLEPVMDDLVRGVERITGGSETVIRRLDRLGTPRTLQDFRAEQLVWGLLGSAAGLALGALTSWGLVDGALRTLGLMAIGALLGVLGRDRLLTREVSAREARMLQEFPSVAELLALAVGAGEGALGALERVARSCRGELSAELRRAVAETRAGAGLVEALGNLADRTAMASVARFVDGIAVALDRGTPLAEVLRAQAQDVRELSRRRLMEMGGRKEIAMMVPVVFLILPVTVLFAVYPGLAILDLDL